MAATKVTYAFLLRNTTKNNCLLQDVQRRCSSHFTYVPDKTQPVEGKSSLSLSLTLVVTSQTRGSHVYV